MTARTLRVLELVVAAGCAALALVKLVGPPAEDDARVAAAVLGVVEAGLAAWLIDGRRPRLAATAVAAFGVALAVAASTASPAVGGRGCGCLGPFHADQSRRLLVAGALVLLAGLRLSSAPSGGTRGAAAAE